MAHTVDEVNVLIKAQAEQFQKEINRVNSKLDSISTHAAKASAGVAAGAKGMGLKMLGLGAVVGAVSAVTQKAMTAIAASTGSAIKRFDTLNNFPRVMQNLGISADTSQKSINYLAKKLEGLPTTLDEATTAVQRLTATNGNLRASTAIYLALNNAILAGGANAELQASAMEQLQQAYSKGKPELQDWKTLMQAMPAQLKQIANAMGYADATQLYDALQNGRASMDDFMQTVVRLNKEGINGLSSFEQQAAGATGGVATSFANMKNAIVRGLAACMDAIGQSNIAGFFNFVRDVISTASNYVVAFIKLVVSAINAIRALFGQGSIGAKSVESSGAKASDSMANVGKAAQGSTKDIGNTAKAAKKLQKQLAGFDEMNVLSKQDTSGSGGSGGGGGGSASPSYNVSGIDFDDSGIQKNASEVDKIVEQIKTKFKDLGNFIFENFSKTLSRASSIFKSLGSIASKTAGFISNSFEKNSGKISSAFETSFSGATKLWDSLLNSLLAGSDGFLAGFNTRWQQVGQATTDSFTNIISNALIFSGELSVQLARPFDAIAPYLEVAGSNMGQFMAQVLSDWIISIDENLPFITGGFLDTTDSITENLSTFAEIAGGIWEGFTSSLKDNWNIYGKSIADGIMKTIGNIIDTFKRIQQEILDPIIKPFLDEFKKVWDEHIKGMIDEVIKFVMTLVRNATEIYNKFIKPITDFLIGILSPIFVAVFGAIGGIINDFLRVASSIIKSVIGIFRGLLDFITGIFTGNWERAWEGVKTIFSNIASGLGNIFKAPINFIISIINGFIRGLNKIKIPNWVPAVGGKGINIPEIPKLAHGGITKSATLAMIGEAGREAVLPLENNTGWMDELASKINSRQQDQNHVFKFELNGHQLEAIITEMQNDRSFLQNYPALNF